MPVRPCVTFPYYKKKNPQGWREQQEYSSIRPTIHPFMHNRVKLIGKPMLADMSDLQRAQEHCSQLKGKSLQIIWKLLL